MSKRLTSVALASLSPRRKYLLESIGLTVEIVAGGYEEPALSSDAPAANLALLHARGKAQHAQRSGPSVLIAADTLVEIGGEVLGKPCDAAAACSMLRKLSGRTHRVYTGFVVRDRETNRERSSVESTLVRFLPLSESEIQGYVATGEPLDKAGAYGILGQGSLLVESISGDFYTVVGLPLVHIGTSLRELGYSIFES